MVMKKKCLAMILTVGLSLNLLPSAAAFTATTSDERATLSTGGSNTAYIKEDGTLWACGIPDYNVLGDIEPNVIQSLGENAFFGSAQTVPVYIMDDVVSVSFGGGYAGAIQSDGSLWMWGRNDCGQIGNGISNTNDENRMIQFAEPQKEPVKIMDSVAQVSCGSNSTVAVQTDGSLWVWGDNEKGQLGNTSFVNQRYGSDGAVQNVPAKLMDGVKAAVTREDCFAAIKTDGSLWIWGFYLDTLKEDGFYGTTHTTPKKLMDDVKTVSLGSGFMAVIKNDGSLWMRGVNSKGQLGNGTRDTAVDFVKVMDQVVDVSCGREHTAAVKADGSLWTWGANYSGQLGNNGVGNVSTIFVDSNTGYSSGVIMQTTPIKVMDDVVSVSCGSAHTAVIRKDGSIWTWGSNGSGELGNEITTEETIPSLGVAKKPTKIATGVALPNGETPQQEVSGSELEVCGFSDVLVTDYYADAVKWAVEHDVFEGIGPFSFVPDTQCTNFQVLDFLWKANGSPEPEGTVTFTNVENEKYIAPCTWALQEGLLSQDSYGEYGYASRADLVAYLWKLAGKPQVNLLHFTDVPADAEYAQAVSWAVQEGITSGTSDTTFSPKELCTRAQIVTFLYQVFGK